MMTPGQAFEIETLQRELAIEDGSLIEFAQQFAVDDCSHCGRGKDLFTLAKLTNSEADVLIRQLQIIGRSEPFKGMDVDAMNREVRSAR